MVNLPNLLNSQYDELNITFFFSEDGPNPTKANFKMNPVNSIVEMRVKTRSVIGHL